MALLQLFLIQMNGRHSNMKAYHLMGSAPYYTNCYLLTDNEGNAVLFDCSIRWSKIQEILDNDKAELKAVFMTHGHHDHRECMEELRQNCDAPIYMGHQDIMQFHMEGLQEYKEKETFEIGEDGMAKYLEFDKQDWVDAVLSTVPEKFREANEKAFLAGYEQ